MYVGQRLLFEGQPIGNIASYAKLDKTDASITIKVNRDGAGSAYGFADLLTLTSDNLPDEVTIQELISSGQLIVP